MPSEILNASLVPAVAGVEYAMTQAGLPSRFAPLAAVLVGVSAECLAATYGYHHGPINYANAVFLGVGIGLAGGHLKTTTVVTYATGRAAVRGTGHVLAVAASHLPRLHRPTAPPARAISSPVKRTPSAKTATPAVAGE